MDSSTTLYLSGHGGVELAATSFGSDKNPLVLLLHGAGQTRHSWRNAGRSLAQAGWYAITIDTRGHGNSHWPDNGDYSIDTLMADISVVSSRLSQSSGEKPVLVGASLGGITGLLLQGEASQRHFRSLILVDITPRIDNVGVARIIEFMNRHHNGFGSLKEAASAVAEYQSHGSPARRDAASAKAAGEAAAESGHKRAENSYEGLKKNLRLADDGRYYWHWDPRLMEHIGTIDEGFYQRQRAAASNLELPVLLIRGQQSEIVDRESVTEFLELVPHAEYVDVADAAHMVAGDNNDVFVQSLLDFLSIS